MPSIVYQHPFFNFVDQLAELAQDNQCGNAPSADSQKRSSTKDPKFSPDLDIYESDEGYVAYVDIPGAKREELSVDYDQQAHQLVVSGSVARNVDGETLKTLKYSSRPYGKFERRVKLANKSGIDTDYITAKYVDGVLEVKVPKAKEAPKLNVHIE